MTDSFGISDGNFDDSALVASRWTSGGNSAAARRARVKLQRRDRYGRWAEMGGGVSFPGKLSDGSTRTVIGRYVGPAKRDGYMRVEVTDPKAGVPKGVYEVNGRVATVSKAILSGEQLEEAGVKLDVNGKRIGENLDRDIEPFTSMYQDKAPDAAETHLVTKGLSDDEKKVEAKARLEARAVKNFPLSDQLRDEIAAAGFDVLDVAGGFELRERERFPVYVSTRDIRHINTGKSDLVLTIIVDGFIDDAIETVKSIKAHTKFPIAALVIGDPGALVDEIDTQLRLVQITENFGWGENTNALFL